MIVRPLITPVKTNTRLAGNSSPNKPLSPRRNETQESQIKQPSFCGGMYFSRILNQVELSQKVNAQNIASDILRDLKTFGMDEYKNLSQSDKSALRCCKPFTMDSPNELLYMAKTMKANLSKKFPDGYTLVSVGRSPALITKLLESMGVDVKFCPTSRMGSKLFLENLKPHINEYASYLEKLGISKEIIENSQNPHVFIDYTYTGDSLNHFKQALSCEKIGIKAPKAQFLSMNNDLLDCADKKYMKYLINKWLFDPLGKQYSPIPRATLNDILKNPDSLTNEKETFDSKMMQFHLIDALEMQKALMSPSIKNCA